MAEEIKKEAVDTAETAETQEEEAVSAEPQETESAPENENSAETDSQATAEQEPQEAETKKRFGKKKDKKDKKDEKIEELTDQLKRQMAEFDNYRKRTEKEKASMYVIGAKEIVEKILPIVDNFERGLSSVPDDQKEDPFVDGMDKIYRQLMTALEEMGVKVIEAVGQEFNPDLHNAVMHVEDEEAGENIIVEEFQKGYLYKDFVVRHSMVKVAN
ncbi:nucleotide exchange factor GrpE [Ruminococcus sp. OA3]|uniref:nucleotide exchange factor GrpE n=1 Tax=Ruminococcus sp. OA3 TaxID=2914164 RepID=UPI001F0577C5|nr:nucleotide exchange factor GrpE [Ruminococcus sp. OA3]MCH1982757.1 nucleotide exchange factor GrpE [Ruminococcus sp. OA3]